MAANQWLGLLGTLNSYLKLGLTGVRLKNNSGNLAVRNNADSADAQITASKLNNTGTTIDIGTTNVLTLEQNSSQSGALTLRVPAAKSTDGYALTQKAGTGAGVIELEFTSVSGSTNAIKSDTTTLAFGSTSPVTMFQLPVGAVIHVIDIIIDTAFNGTPSATVGIAGTTSKYTVSTECDLTASAGTVFSLNPGVAAPGSAEDLIITYSAGGASAGSARFVVYYSVPA